jgi:hypothetical protein
MTKKLSAAERTGLAVNLKNKPLRVCQTLHECCLCTGQITLGQHYYDGGYRRRAHLNCVDKNS